MKNLLNIFVFLLLGGSHSTAQETTTSPFDVEKAQGDFDIYKEIVETTHSGMYLYTPKDEFDLSIFGGQDKDSRPKKLLGVLQTFGGPAHQDQLRPFLLPSFRIFVF